MFNEFSPIVSVNCRRLIHLQPRSVLIALIFAAIACISPWAAKAQTTFKPIVGSAYCQLLMKEAAIAIAAKDNITAAKYNEAVKQYNCGMGGAPTPGFQPRLGNGTTSNTGTLSFNLISDQLPTTGAGPRLCLAVDADKPLTLQKSIVGGVNSLPSVTFYPVIVQSCSLLQNQVRDSSQPGTSSMGTTWTVTDTRELRATVNGSPMCLSARYGNSFNNALSSAYLSAFQATVAGSPFAYLVSSLANGPSGSVGGRYQNPELVASPCGKSDAVDFFTYDDLSGTISGPDGFLQNGSALPGRKCVAIDGNPRVAGSNSNHIYESGMPVYSADCSDMTAYDRNEALPAEHWTATIGSSSLPTYLAPKPGDYYSGRAGLPITGPLGRCLTADNLAPDTVVTSDCDGRVEQLWKAVGGTIQLGASGTCLTTGSAGALTLSTCVSNAANQQWTYNGLPADPAMYDTPYAIPATTWTNRWIYGQIQPAGAPTQCLAVSVDPFTDPIRQRNPVALVGCSSVLPRQTSWFRPTRVRTVRVGLLRYSNDAEGHGAAMGTEPDQCMGAVTTCVASTAQGLSALLSQYFQVLGVRFVFDPGNDLKDVNNQTANTYSTASWAAADMVSGDASKLLYGKMAIALAAGYVGGELSSGDNVEYDPNLIIDPIVGPYPLPNPCPSTGPCGFPVTPNERLPDYQNDITVPKDPGGLPALSYFALTAAINSTPINVTPHEIGHYLSLQHTFNLDEFLDTPPDTGDGSGWLFPGSSAGSTTCGNLRTAPTTANGTTMVTPDRNEIESYWGCMVGRAHASISPYQLARASWMLNNQLNRYPLVACQPLNDYDADQVECENAASLALCQQTAAYLSANMQESMTCRAGGKYTRMIAGLLADAHVQALLAEPAGRQLITKLAVGSENGQPVTTAGYAAWKANVQAALINCVNLPLTMAIANRLNAFVLSNASATAATAAATFTPMFIADVPQLP